MTVQQGGWDYFNTGFENGPGATPAARSFDAYTGPANKIVPETQASALCGTLQANCNSGTIEAVRVTINPGDDVTAADRLANGTTDTIQLSPEESIRAVTDSNTTITEIYILVVGDGGTDAGGDNIVDSSAVKNVNGQLATTLGTVAMEDVTSAQILAATNMIHLSFASGDAVRGVDISVSRTYSTNTKAYITIEGSGYA